MYPWVSRCHGFHGVTGVTGVTLSEVEGGHAGMVPFDFAQGDTFLQPLYPRRTPLPLDRRPPRRYTGGYP